MKQPLNIQAPPQPKNSFRVILNLATAQRLDAVLLAELRAQDRNSQLKVISRKSFKELFKTRRIQLKGQSAVPSSFLAEGVSYVDILGFEEQEVAAPRPAEEEAS
jgi:hypothetical protein